MFYTEKEVKIPIRKNRFKVHTPSPGWATMPTGAIPTSKNNNPDNNS